jgi:hypothetical protein
VGSERWHVLRAKALARPATNPGLSLERARLVPRASARASSPVRSAQGLALPPPIKRQSQIPRSGRALFQGARRLLTWLVLLGHSWTCPWVSGWSLAWRGFLPGRRCSRLGGDHGQQFGNQALHSRAAGAMEKGRWTEVYLKRDETWLMIGVRGGPKQDD